MAAHQAPPSLGFSRQEHWSGLPFPSPTYKSEKWKGSRSVVSNSSQLHWLQPTRLLCPWDFPGKSTGVGCHCLLLEFRNLVYLKPPNLLSCLFFPLVECFYFHQFSIINSFCANYDVFYYDTFHLQSKFRNNWVIRASPDWSCSEFWFFHIKSKMNFKNYLILTKCLLLNSSALKLTHFTSDIYKS